MPLNLERRSLGKHSPSIQHANAIADGHHDAHVMLDQKHAASEGVRDRRDESHQGIALRLRHAGGRLIKQDKARRQGQGATNSQSPLIRVGQRRCEVGRFVGQINAGKHFIGDRRSGSPRATEGNRRDLNVFVNRQILEQTARLKRSGDSFSSEAIGRPGVRFFSVQQDATFCRLLEPAETIDQRGLPGSVRPDEADDFVATNAYCYAGKRI